MNYLFCDFETFYNSKSKYSLKNLSMVEYIRDKRFKAFGMGMSWNNENAFWMPEECIQDRVNDIDLSQTIGVSHNCKFDWSILAWHYGIKPKIYIDTVSLAKAILGPLVKGYSLADVAEYLQLPTKKGILKTDGKSVLSATEEKELSEYCINDVILCRQIFEILMPQFPENELQSLDWTARAFIEPKLMLDTEHLRKAVEDEKARRELAIKRSGAGAEVLRSNLKFAELVRGNGLPVSTKVSNRTGLRIPAFSKSDEGLRQLQQLSPELYQGRLAAKSSLLETRALKLYEISKTGAWPFDVSYSGAVQTHRYSGAGGAGGNPQNFPRKGPIRESVIAPEGYSLVVGDFAQIEARLVAWLAQEPKLIKVFSDERDVYAEFASELYGRRITRSDELERQFGKEGILGLGYGMGWRKFQARVKQVMGVDIDEKEARRVVEVYRTTYFNVPRLWDRAQALLPLIRDGRQNRVSFAPYISVGKSFLQLPSGLRLQYPNLRIQGAKYNHPRWVRDTWFKKSGTEEKDIWGGTIIENICQALAGEVTKLTIKTAQEMGINCVGQCHDEVICLAPDNKAERVQKTLKEIMQTPPKWLPSIRLCAEVGIGSSWTAAKV